MAMQLYQITDEFPFQERVAMYHGLTLKQAAIRMDDLTGCGEDVILADWDEPCERCGGKKVEIVGQIRVGQEVRQVVDCTACDGDGKWPGPWEFTDEETGREVTMTRAPR
jgi:DnaJ-class molecular chaperone